MSSNSKPGKAHVRFWLKRFKMGTMLNEIQINRDSAFKFFGVLPVMRGSTAELWRILFARQIMALEDEELRLKVEDLRKANKYEPRLCNEDQAGTKPADMAKPQFGGDPVPSGWLAISINPWLMACSHLYNLSYGSMACVKAMRLWAASVLKKAGSLP